MWKTLAPWLKQCSTCINQDGVPLLELEHVADIVALSYILLTPVVDLNYLEHSWELPVRQVTVGMGVLMLEGLQIPILQSRSRRLSLA